MLHSIVYACELVGRINCCMGGSAVTQVVEILSPRQVTHLPTVWDLLLLLAHTPSRREQQPLLVFLLKDVGNVG